jgi:hypothetical protein
MSNFFFNITKNCLEFFMAFVKRIYKFEAFLFMMKTWHNLVDNIFVYIFVNIFASSFGFYYFLFF